MLAHSAFLGLVVVVVVFSDGGAQNHIFGYIIGISHFHFFANFFDLFHESTTYASDFLTKRISTNMPKIWQKMKKKNWSN